jgi:hypothetical protein
MLEYIEAAYEIAQTLLIAVGLLKIFSRYTPWKWDDKLFDVCEKPVRQVRDFIRKEK